MSELWPDVVLKLTMAGVPLATSVPTLMSGLHSWLTQLGSLKHSGSAQSMSPLLLSSTPLLQISLPVSVDSVTVTGPSPSASND